jgi:DNA-binding transcriptional ArsR family regulator
MKLRRDIFQAISDPTRRTILVLLASQAMTAGAIANNFDAARPTISKHLQILNECDLIEANKQGREIYYELKIEKMKEVDKWLEQFRKIWENRFDKLYKVLSKLKNQKK